MATKIAKKVITDSGVVWNWADGVVTKVKVKDFGEAIIEHAAKHGLGQKLGDSYSGAKSVAAARAAFEEVLATLKGGDWNRKGGSSGGVWVEAIARATGEEFADVLAKWEAMDDETKAGVKKHPQVKLAKAQIDLERTQKATSDSESEPLTL